MSAMAEFLPPHSLDAEEGVLDAAGAASAPAPRRAVMVRMPTPMYRRVRMAAAAADMSVSAYMVRTVTDAMEMTAP